MLHACGLVAGHQAPASQPAAAAAQRQPSHCCSWRCAAARFSPLEGRLPFSSCLCGDAYGVLRLVFYTKLSTWFCLNVYFPIKKKKWQRTTWAVQRAPFGWWGKNDHRSTCMCSLSKSLGKHDVRLTRAVGGAVEPRLEPVVTRFRLSPEATHMGASLLSMADIFFEALAFRSECDKVVLVGNIAQRALGEGRCF